MAVETLHSAAPTVVEKKNPFLAALMIVHLMARSLLATDFQCVSFFLQTEHDYLNLTS